MNEIIYVINSLVGLQMHEFATGPSAFDVILRDAFKVEGMFMYMNGNRAPWNSFEQMHIPFCIKIRYNTNITEYYLQTKYT